MEYFKITKLSFKVVAQRSKWTVMWDPLDDPYDIVHIIWSISYGHIIRNPCYFNLCWNSSPVTLFHCYFRVLSLDCSTKYGTRYVNTRYVDNETRPLISNILCNLIVLSPDPSNI